MNNTNATTMTTTTPSTTSPAIRRAEQHEAAIELLRDRQSSIAGTEQTRLFHAYGDVIDDLATRAQRKEG